MIHVPHAGLLFCAAFAVMLFASWLMGRQGRFFFTKDPVKRKFSILEMEFPAKSFELENLINGIYQLPESPQIVKALKAQLLLDYILFIPATYGGIYILCMYTADNLVTTFGRCIFTGLAWAQIVTFLLDYAENTYFWMKITAAGRKPLYVRKPDPSKPEAVSGSFRRMQVLEAFKWGLPLIGTVCSLSVMAYFWLSGYFFHCSPLF